MENASDALKIAFGLMLFATAIIVLFMLTGNTRTTADAVLSYADETTYYSHVNSRDKNRKATISDVITTLYRYYNESVAVTIKFKSGNTYLFDVNNETYKMSKYEDKAFSSVEEVEENLGDFVKKKLMVKPNAKFLETFVEVPTSGIYWVEPKDESEVTITAGNKKIYITYEEI